MATNINTVLKPKFKNRSLGIAYCKLYSANYTKLLQTAAFEFINYQLLIL